MAVRGTNTMQEALQRLLTDVAQMKTLADADLPWLVELESMVIGKIREPLDQMNQSGQLPPAGPGGGPMGGAMPAPGGSPGLSAGTPMGGGMNAGAAAPNADELARLLNVGNGA